MRQLLKAHNATVNNITFVDLLSCFSANLQILIYNYLIMKRITLLFIGICFYSISHAAGYDFVADGMAYKINADNMSVTMTYMSHNNFFDTYFPLTEVSVPEQVSHAGKTYAVTSIDGMCFMYCDQLSTVTLPKGLQSIGDRAFDGCTALLSINLPSSVTDLSPTAFARCANLEELTVDSDNPIYDSRNNCNGIIETSTNTLLLGCKSTVIPDDVTSIGAHAFEGSGITSISIPGSVSSFGEDAFANCADLTQVHINDIASWCAVDFANLKSSPLHSTYDKRSTFFNYRTENVVRTEDTYFKEMHLYVGDQEVTDLVIPDNVNEIKAYAFAFARSIKSVCIPSSVTTIGRDAFLCLDNCTSVDIDDIASWCNIDFANAGSNPMYDMYYKIVVEEKRVPDLGDEYYMGTVVYTNYSFMRELYSHHKPLTEIVIPEGVTTIKPYAFVSLHQLGSLTIPSTMQEIGTSAFEPSYDIYGSIDEIGQIKELVWNAKRCSTRGNMYSGGIKHLIIGNGVEVLPDSLAISSQITQLSIPASVQRIGNYAFANVNNSHIYAEPAIAPECQSQTFTRYGAWLHTLNDAMASYFDAPVWSNFTMLMNDLIVPQDLSIDQTMAYMEVNKSVKLNATATGTDMPLEWYSLNEEIARVDNNGNVTGLKEGETDVIVTCHNLRRVCHVIVAGELNIVSLNKEELEMTPNEIATLIPTYSGGTATFAASSSNIAVAKVKVVGNVVQILAISPGRAVITVSTETITSQPATCLVIVGGEQPHADINGDGMIDISDVNSLINMMLGKEDPTSEADLNGDGHVDIADVNAVINAMLGKE